MVGVGLNVLWLSSLVLQDVLAVQIAMEPGGEHVLQQFVTFILQNQQLPHQLQQAPEQNQQLPHQLQQAQKKRAADGLSAQPPVCTRFLKKMKFLEKNGNL